MDGDCGVDDRDRHIHIDYRSDSSKPGVGYSGDIVGDYGVFNEDNRMEIKEVIGKEMD